MFDEQSMRISDQLSGYDETSPNSDDQSKVLGSQPAIGYSNANGNAQSSPSIAVPITVKDNILKVNLCLWYMACSVLLFTIAVVL